MKKILILEELEDIISSNKLNRLVGYAENSFFDAKKVFYNLDRPKGKHEICKDITAFANNDGGYLIIGCETVRSESSKIDYVEKVEGISDFPDIDRIFSILLEYIYPKPMGTLIDIKQTESAGNKFLLIKVNGKSKEKPYFVKKDAREMEFAAYYFRTHDRGVRHNLEYLHELVHHGINFEEYLKNITGMTEKVMSNTEKLLGKTKKVIPLGLRYDIKKDL